MKNTKTTKQSGGEVSIILFSIFVLAISLLIAGIRLYQQHSGGVPSSVLIVSAIFGITSSLAGLINIGRPTMKSPFPKEHLELSVNQEMLGPREENQVKLRVDKYVAALEDQNKTLRTEKALQEEEMLELRGEIHKLKHTISEWQRRSVEMFRLIERVVNSDVAINEAYVQAMLRTKKHFTQLVTPMAVNVIEPVRGDRFDEKLHQAADEAGDKSLEPWTVVDCLQWGYTINGEVETPAKVVISRTE